MSWLVGWITVGAMLASQRTVLAFQSEAHVSNLPSTWQSSKIESSVTLWMAKATKKKKKKGSKAGGGSSGLKGFGAVGPSSTSQFPQSPA